MSKERDATVESLVEALTPRIYIDFCQAIEDAVCDEDRTAHPIKLATGPYHNVWIADGTLWACHSGSRDDEPDEFALASSDGRFWRLHDGAEDVRYHINIHTVRPGKPDR